MATQTKHGKARDTKVPGHRIFTTPFAAVYPMYVEKAKRKGRTKEEVDRVICWLTATPTGLAHEMNSGLTSKHSLLRAQMHPTFAHQGVRGVRVEEVEDH
jgi:hypothetical protein